MRIPTQKQWAIVIEKLYSVLPFALQQDNSLNMLEVRVNVGQLCGTVHCVGGWYAFASWQEDALNRIVPLTYINGANAMAEDLGFYNERALRVWAYDNRKIWGNSLGMDMFAMTKAYDHGNGPAKSLSDVIRHFEFVADNCKKVRPWSIKHSQKKTH